MEKPTGVTRSAFLFSFTVIRQMKMKSQISIVTVFLLGVLSFTGCTTFQIPVQSFRQQFAGVDMRSLQEVRVNGPYGMPIRYLANLSKIPTIKCVDANNKEVILQNSPSIEVRFTHNGKRNIMYFDRLFIKDSAVVGSPSTFMPGLMHVIPLRDITKIEVQDGHKNFHYVDRR